MSGYKTIEEKKALVREHLKNGNIGKATAYKSSLKMNHNIDYNPKMNNPKVSKSLTKRDFKNFGAYKNYIKQRIKKAYKNEKMGVVSALKERMNRKYDIEIEINKKVEVELKGGKK